MDEAKRREKLKETIKQAAKELLEVSERMAGPIAGLSFPLDEAQTMWVIIRAATEDEAGAELDRH